MPQKKSERKSAVRISIIYIIIGSIWILCSDEILYRLIKDPTILTQFQTFKGWFFILITAIVLFFLIKRDIGLLNTAQKKLSYSEEKFSKAFQKSPDLITISTFYDGKYIDVNEGFLDTSGYSREEVIDKSADELNFWYDQSEKDSFIRNFDEKEVIQNLEVKFRKKNGEILICLLSAEVIFVEKLKCIISISRDITDRKKAEEIQKYSEENYKHYLEKVVEERTARLISLNHQLKELNTLKSRFISNASHEFRTPLTVILASTDLLEMFGRNWPIEKYCEHTSKIRRTVKYMIELLDDVLTISREEAGKTAFKPESFNFYDLCQEVIENVKLKKSDAHDIRFIYNSPKQTIVADERLLKQILLNLLVNSVKYSPGGGLIKFIVDVYDNNLSFEISDQGIGIPDENLAVIYEPFNRGENVGSIPGTGLGLSIVKKSVELHNGTLELKSRQNEGTTFYINIPIN